MSSWLADGKIKFREDIVDGLENAPQAFNGLLEGKNFGKLVIRVSQDYSTTERNQHEKDPDSTDLP